LAPVVDPETLVADAARMMSYLDMKRVFVVDQDRVVGVLSQTDIVDALATARLEATGWAENRSDP
jgi:CBS domain-containing protein